MNLFCAAIFTLWVMWTIVLVYLLWRDVYRVTKAGEGGAGVSEPEVFKGLGEK